MSSKLLAAKAKPIDTFAYESVTSTMDVARSLRHKDKVALPFAVRADEQTAGRGRLGSDWVSPRGNLYTTLVLDPQLKQADRAKLSFVVALALFDALTVAGPLPDLRLKWPNDLLLAGSKIAGLLLEAETDGVLMIGMGVNLRSAPSPSDLAQRPYVARDLQGVVTQSPGELLSNFLTAFEAWLAKLQQGQFAIIRETWLGRAYGIGNTIQVRLPNLVYHGVFQGIDADGGLLLLESDGNVRTILAGSVFFDF